VGPNVCNHAHDCGLDLTDNWFAIYTNELRPVAGWIWVERVHTCGDVAWRVTLRCL